MGNVTSGAKDLGTGVHLANAAASQLPAAEETDVEGLGNSQLEQPQVQEQAGSGEVAGGAACQLPHIPAGITLDGLITLLLALPISEDSRNNLEDLRTREASLRDILVQLAQQEARHAREQRVASLEEDEAYLGSLANPNIQRGEIGRLKQEEHHTKQQILEVIEAMKAHGFEVPDRSEERPNLRGERGRMASRLMGLWRREEYIAKDLQPLLKKRRILDRKLALQAAEDSSTFKPGAYLEAIPLSTTYILQKLVGKGSSSRVFKALEVPSGKTVALKLQQYIEGTGGKELREIREQYAQWDLHFHRALNHPNIVKVVASFELDNCLATIQDLYPGSTLEDYLEVNTVIPEMEARDQILRVLSGLMYLGDEERRMVHCNLQPGKILMSGRDLEVIKITGFGKRMIVGQPWPQRLLSSRCTDWYKPPEMCKASEQPLLVSTKVDTWAVGVIFYKLVTGVLPFGEGLSADKLGPETPRRTWVFTFPAKPRLTERCKQFICSCLAFEEEDRLDVAAAHDHSYFKEWTDDLPI